MANIRINDLAGFGLDLRADGDWIEIISSIGELTSTGTVAGPATINVALEFDNGAFSGLLELEPEGNLLRLDRLTITDANEVVAFAGTEINALVSLTTNIAEIEVFGDPFESADSIFGNRFADFINSGAGADSIEGAGGNDTFVGGTGDDTLDGGADTDTAEFSGSQNSYTLTLSPTATAITDRRADGNGTDQLIDMEFLDFDTGLQDGPFDLVKVGGTAALSGPDLETFIELYIAYFNRAPDAVGLNFWGTAFANGFSLEQIATFFVDQPETRATYPDGTSNVEFAEAVYMNVLGRTPDESGFNFWVNALDSGGVTRDFFILDVLRGAKSDLKPEEGQAFVDQQLLDRAYLADKTDIGAYFSVHKGMSDVPNAIAAMQVFDGTDASISAAVSVIDDFHASALNANSGEFLMPLVGVLDDPFLV